MFATTWICETTIKFMTSKCGSGIPSENLAFEWKCAVNVKYMPRFEDSVLRMLHAAYLINNLNLDSVLKW